MGQTFLFAVIFGKQECLPHKTDELPEIAEAAWRRGKKPNGGWLFKEEPGHYNYADLERDGSTLWDGVDNNLARQHLRNVKAGDRVLYYHTGNEKAVVGEMTVLEGAMPDPGADDPKAVVVRVRAVKRWPQAGDVGTDQTGPGACRVGIWCGIPGCR